MGSTETVEGVRSPLRFRAAVELAEPEAQGRLAFQIRQSKEFRRAKARRPRTKHRWDFGSQNVSPDLVPEAPLVSCAEGHVPLKPTNARMKGRIECSSQCT